MRARALACVRVFPEGDEGNLRATPLCNPTRRSMQTGKKGQDGATRFTGSLIRVVSGGDCPPEIQRDLMAVLPIVAKARNGLDAQPIIDLLAEDAIYEAQNVMGHIAGKAKIAAYLLDRFDFFREQKAKGRETGALKLAIVDSVPWSKTPCLAFEADGKRPALWILVLDKSCLIKRIDVVTIAPSPASASLLE